MSHITTLGNKSVETLKPNLEGLLQPLEIHFKVSTFCNTHFKQHMKSHDSQSLICKIVLEKTLNILFKLHFNFDKLIVKPF